MKMSTNFASPTYNTETCNSFNLALVPDTVSLFEVTNSWADVPTPTDAPISRQTSSLISFTTTSVPSTVTAMKLDTGSYSTLYSCTTPVPSTVVTIVASSTIS